MGGGPSLRLRPNQTPNKGSALARGPRFRRSSASARVKINYNEMGKCSCRR